MHPTIMIQAAISKQNAKRMRQPNVMAQFRALMKKGQPAVAAAGGETPPAKTPAPDAQGEAVAPAQDTAQAATPDVPKTDNEDKSAKKRGRKAKEA